jgi:predicted branched-subunit amino acid permease
LPSAGAGRDFVAGAAAMVPVLIAAAPFALLIGALAVDRGLSVGEAGAMSAAVFAGSSQVVVLNGWTAPPGLAAIAVATLVVNLRHVLMSASIRPHMAHWPAWTRPVALFFLADEVWALAEARAAERRLGLAYFAGLALPLYLTWTAATVAGAALGRLVAEPRALGFDFAFIAIFIGLVMGFRRRPGFATTVAAAGATAALVHLASPGAWSIAAGAVAGMAAAALTARPDREGWDGGREGGR